jgi:hypothetical protein
MLVGCDGRLETVPTNTSRPEVCRLALRRRARLVPRDGSISIGPKAPQNHTSLSLAVRVEQKRKLAYRLSHR